MIDLDLVDTIVFLVMENRSFDHMLGHLSYGPDAPMPEVDGLRAPLTQRAYENIYRGEPYYPFEMRDAVLPGDVPHHRHEIAQQMALSPVTGRYQMSGFAESYFEYLDIQNTSRPASMGYLPAAGVPVTSFFAQNYAVCDRWFSPLPTSTQPNKLMSLEGTSTIDDTKPRIVPADRLVIDWLSDHDVRWRVYHEGLSFFALFGRIPEMFDRTIFRPFAELAEDVQNEADGSYPQVIFVEPTYESAPHIGPANDDHAPLPAGPGEAFQKRVYEALTSNPDRWAKTVFVITYDEHGGFFDHVPPLPVGYTPPDNEYTPFISTGPRVPGLVVSPLVEPRTVFHEPLDHTSMLQLVAEKFAPGEAGYSEDVNSRRDGDPGIRSVSAVLNRDAPRTDIAAAPDLDLPDGVVEERSWAADPIERAFEAAGRKAVAEKPDETRALFPDAYEWLEKYQETPDPAFDVQGLGDLFRKHGRKELRDPDLPRDLLEAKVSLGKDVSMGGDPELTLSVGAGARATIQSFHDPHGIDPDGILTDPEDKAAHEIFPPQLELDGEHAWLKYLYEVDLSAGAGIDPGDVGFTFDTERKLQVTDYRRHDADAVTMPALLGDVSTPRFALRVADAHELGTGDCIAMRFIGQVGAEVTLSWGDILASQFGNLGSALGSDEVIPLRISAGLKLTASVRFTDDFIFAVSRKAADRLQVAVRKAEQRKHGFSFEATVEVGFNDKQQVTAALNEIVAGHVGAPYEEITGLLETDLVDQLTSTQAGVLLLLLKKAGLPEEIPDGINEVRDLIGEVKDWLALLKSTVEQAIEEIASAKIAAGFKYEYSRTATHAALLEATVTDAVYDGYHEDLKRGRLEGLLGAIQQGAAGVELVSYLERDTVEINKAWGFTLGIGRWSIVGMEDEDVVRIIDRNLAGQRKFAYQGLRAYEGKGPFSELRWAMDLKADMDHFSQHDLPTMDEFQLGLSFTWEHNVELEEKEVDRLLDSANLWGVIDEDGFERVKAPLQDSLDKDCRLTVQMRVPDETLRTMLPALRGALFGDLCGPLGAAMPWREGMEGRRIAETRRKLYGPLWAWHFDHPGTERQELADWVAEMLERNGHPELHEFEEHFDVIRSQTFAGIVELNDRRKGDLEQFLAGIKLLAQGVTEDLPDDDLIASVFDRIKYIAKQSHHIRAIGYYLDQIAHATGVGAQIERTASVDDGDNVIVFGPDVELPGSTDT